MKKFDCEVHFYTQDYVNTMYANPVYPNFRDDTEAKIRTLSYNAAVRQPFAQGLLNNLLEHGEQRLKKMDANGIDVQILSISAPGVEQFDPQIGTELARKANYELFAVTRRHPGRFLGYASLAVNDPKAAVTELERCIKELGFVGWNTHSNYGSLMLDDPKYIPILEKAAQLDVPVYVHPTVSASESLKSYGFALAGAPFGFGIDTAVCVMRLIYSGIFDRFPNLKIILGHLGEGLPFIFKRINWAYVRPFEPKLRPTLKRMPSEYLQDNFWVTTSGQFHVPSFICTLETLGPDRILLGSDYPYEDMDESVQFLKSLPVSQEIKDKIFSHNAAALLEK